LGLTAFLTGNAVQANTAADTLWATFRVPTWLTGAATAGLVAAVIVGGITRIGRVTAVLAPLMAAIYVLGALLVLFFHAAQVVPSLLLIVREAFSPSAGVAGTGAGVLLTTLMWGVKRGLFSNEAGQGSAPIAHAAAKTDELVICTMTGLVIVVTGAWTARAPTQVGIAGGNVSYVLLTDDGRFRTAAPPERIRVEDGVPVYGAAVPRLAWHEAPLERLFVDAAQTRPFSGTILPSAGRADADDGESYRALYADAVRNGAPLTMLAFERGLGPLGFLGPYIVLVSVLLFAVSTAIAWSYYGDRCAHYLLGPKAVLPYKVVYVGMHFFGAVVSLSVAWTLGDVFLGVVILPNLLALLLLSGQVREMTDSYFTRRPWIENAEAHRRALERRRAGR
jgi:AGCS family alanine or glycine:cation symporter